MSEGRVQSRGVQGLGPAPAPVVSDHQQRVQPLTDRMCRDELQQLDHGLGMPGQAQVRLDPQLARLQPHLGHDRCRRRRVRRPQQLGELIGRDHAAG